MSTRILFLVLVLLAGFALLRKPQPPPATHSIVPDRSTSTVDGCACLREYARVKIAAATRRGETLVLYATGDSTSAYQPRRVWAGTIPFDATMTGDKTRTQAEAEAVLGELEAACRALPRTKESPLIETVKVVLEQMRGQCPPESRCDVTMQTDLREEVDADLLQRFKVAKRGKLVTASPPKLDNAGISIHFTGVAEMATTSRTAATARLGDGDIWQRLWKEAFTDSARITFEPICAPPPLPPATARAH